jgi:hypothetical protein
MEIKVHVEGKISVWVQRYDLHFLLSNVQLVNGQGQISEEGQFGNVVAVNISEQQFVISESMESKGHLIGVTHEVTTKYANYWHQSI